MLSPATLRGAGRGVDVAYYLIHSMGRGGSVTSQRARSPPPGHSPRWLESEGVERVIYLGGLGDRPHSKHLRSRHETALLLRRHGPPLTYFGPGWS